MLVREFNLSYLNSGFRVLIRDLELEFRAPIRDFGFRV